MNLVTLLRLIWFLHSISLHQSLGSSSDCPAARATGNAKPPHFSGLPLHSPLTSPGYIPSNPTSGKIYSIYTTRVTICANLSSTFLKKVPSAGAREAPICWKTVAYDRWVSSTGQNVFFRNLSKALPPFIAAHRPGTKCSFIVLSVLAHLGVTWQLH
jgi:hypothetical protein